jgi:hypothetical protein
MADEDRLNSFYQATEALRSAIQGDTALDESDQLRLENCLALLHMAYVEWKRRNLTRQRNLVWNAALNKSATEARRLT